MFISSDALQLDIHILQPEVVEKLVAMQGIPRKEAKEVTQEFSYHIHLMYCFVSIMNQ
jgi:hypothetical protein